MRLVALGSLSVFVIDLQQLIFQQFKTNPLHYYDILRTNIMKKFRGRERHVYISRNKIITTTTISHSPSLLLSSMRFIQAG